MAVAAFLVEVTALPTARNRLAILTMPNETRSLRTNIRHELAGRREPERAGLARRLKERFEGGAVSASERRDSSSLTTWAV